MPERKHLETLLEIKQNPSLTQRSLAHRLNISLGLTKAILQNLIYRGWIKAKKMTGRKILYLITPQGIARVTNLVYDRFRETQNYHQYTKEMLTSYLTDLYTKGKRKAAIYGTSQLAEIVYLSLLDNPIKLYTIINDDPLSKKKFLGHKVFSLSNFIEKYSENIFQKNLIILCITGSEKLTQGISQYKNIPKNITIIIIEDILKNNRSLTN